MILGVWGLSRTFFDYQKDAKAMLVLPTALGFLWSEPKKFKFVLFLFFHGKSLLGRFFLDFSHIQTFIFLNWQSGNPLKSLV